MGEVLEALFETINPSSLIQGTLDFRGLVGVVAHCCWVFAGTLGVAVRTPGFRNFGGAALFSEGLELKGFGIGFRGLGLRLSGLGGMRDR